ncbi:DNA replication protein DnaC [Paraburkholderia sp. UCT70]
MNAAYDAGRIALMLNELRLPTIGRLWPDFAERSDKESWQASRLLGALLEHELAERAKRRIERHRAESHLDPTKTLATFDFGVVPMVSKAHVMALATGDSWLEKGATILLFGPPGGGKSHLGSAIGHALIDAGYRVLFTRTGEIVQKLQVARQSLQLPSALAKLDRFDLIILDDLSYVRKDQAETSVLFELIAERYERKSLLITANQPFSGWNDVFPDPGMTVAAIDRLVHHSTIFELNVESYRRRTASDKQKERRRQLPTDNPNGATTMLPCVLPHEGMLLGGLLSFSLSFFSSFVVCRARSARPPATFNFCATYTSAGASADFRRPPRMSSFTRSARHALTRRCSVLSCA